MNSQEEISDIPGCVYMAYCKVNGKRYVGKTVNSMNQRKRSHEKCLDPDRLESKRRKEYAFHKALQKYGKDAFVWRVLHLSEDEKELFRMERHFVRVFNSKAPNGYNLTNGGEGPKGRVVMEETRAKISAGLTGYRHTPEARARMSVAQSGRIVSEETRTKLSASLKGRPGRKLTPERLARLIEASVAVTRGKPLSAERRAKLIAANKGRKASEETRARLRMAVNTGRFVSGDPRQGENHHSAKLTVSKVLEIRKVYAEDELSQYQIADMFGVS